MKKQSVIGISIFIFFLQFTISCAKQKISDSQPSASTNKSTDGLISQSNARKNGNVTIDAEDIENSRKKIVEYCVNYDANILEENLTRDSDDRVISFYRIKIKAENYTLFIDKLSELGKIVHINIRAEDVSDQYSSQTNSIDLLNSQINQAKKTKNQKLLRELEEKISLLKKEKTEIKEKVTASYLNLRISEPYSLSHALYQGFFYGKIGFIYITKILLIFIISAIPILILLLLIKISIAFFKWRAKKMFTAIENMGKKTKTNKSEEKTEKKLE